jgi:hypothetical protein
MGNQKNKLAQDPHKVDGPTLDDHFYALTTQLMLDTSKFQVLLVAICLIFLELI